MKSTGIGAAVYSLAGTFAPQGAKETVRNLSLAPSPRIEQGQIDTIEALDELLLEELSLRENRRIKAALRAWPGCRWSRRWQLRLLVPAVARSQPYHGIGRARLHRPR